MHCTAAPLGLAGRSRQLATAWATVVFRLRAGSGAHRLARKFVKAPRRVPSEVRLASSLAKTTMATRLVDIPPMGAHTHEQCQKNKFFVFASAA